VGGGRRGKLGGEQLEEHLLDIAYIYVCAHLCACSQVRAQVTVVDRQ
jgi:hypothetical protein